MIQETKSLLRELPPLVKFIVLFQIFTNLVIFLDVWIVRQAVGFIWLVFIPGFILLRLIMDDTLDLSETFVLSTGLSIALVMIIGLLVNDLLPLIGIVFPLSTWSLAITYNFLTILLCLLCSVKEGSSAISVRFINFPLILPALVGLLLPSILGALFRNHLILLLVTSVVPFIVCLIVFLGVEDLRSHTWVIFGISLALLLQTYLLTNYIIGFDEHGEFYVFRLTLSNFHWDSTATPLYDINLNKNNSMLSDTILPTIFARIMGVDADLVFKIIFPIILSFFFIALYKLYRLNHDGKQAFLSVFLLITFTISLTTVPTKQIIALLFYVLLFFVLFQRKISSRKKDFLFVFLSVGLVVSHYSISYVFLLSIFLVWIVSMLFKKFSENIKVGHVTLFFTLALAWYIYVSRSASFDAFVRAGQKVFSGIWDDLFNPQARGTVVLSAIGATPAASYLHLLGRVLFMLIELLILLGFVRLIRKRRPLRLSFELVIITSANLIIMIMNIVLPNLATTFRPERFFMVALVFLAPLFLYGCDEFLSYLSRVRFVRQVRIKSIALTLAVIMLVPFFLFQNGVIYEVSKDYSYSLPLSMYRMDYMTLYSTTVDDKEVLAARWLSSMSDATTLNVYADAISGYHVLASYGLISSEKIQIWSSSEQEPSNGTFVYLTKLNTAYGVMLGEFMRPWNTSEIIPQLQLMNKVYTSEECDIYKANG